MAFVIDLKKCKELEAKKGWVTTKVDADAGNGQECVAAVKKLIWDEKPLPTSAWRRGKKVKSGAVLPGTAIATFPKEATRKNGERFHYTGHAAIFAGYHADESGFKVYDQWKGRPFGERPLRYKCGGDVSNDGEAFFVIELKEVPSDEPALCSSSSSYR